MFGENPIRKIQHDTPGRLWVQEIFSTIQGEGPLIGFPATFVRLAGCNLRCAWCDTEFESAFRDKRNKVHINSIQRFVEDFGHRLVVITGGEPMRQNIGPLVNNLAHARFLVQVETSGSCFPPGFPWYLPHVHIVCSPKTAKVHPMMRYASAWKYVVNTDNISDEDGMPCLSTQRTKTGELRAQRLARPTNAAPIYLSPMDEKEPRKNEANLQVAARACIRFNHLLTIQLHKIVGVP